MTPDQIVQTADLIKRTYKRKAAEELRADLGQLQTLGKEAVGLPDKKVIGEVRRLFDEVSRHLGRLQSDEVSALQRRQRNELSLLREQHKLPKRAF
ncbi:hypothetical protein ABIB25_003845 [Nakamurella sp. UYEF19]|uniref:hypothetical protein n=1 Tax=Nakamurella sp. UYEF19 TaxID=1756392 RepID=UPI00339B0E79